MKFTVMIPIKGTCSFSVEADDEAAAKDAAWSKVDQGEEGDVTWEYFEDRRTGDEIEVYEDDAATPAEGAGDPNG